MNAEVKQLDRYPDLIQGFDHIRAGRYFDAERLIQAIEDTQTIDLVERFVPDWQGFSSAYRAAQSGTRAITRVANFLKIFEVSVLATYVTLLGINLFTQTAWMPVVLPWATVFVFVYFGFTYGVTFFAVDKPAEKFLQNYAANKKFEKGLYRLVCKYIEDLDRALLETGRNAGEFGLRLFAKDYPGIYVTTRPARVVGERFYGSIPYPLHTVFAGNHSQIRVLMCSYRDDHLLRALSDMSGKIQIKLVVTQNISGHDIFKRAADHILEKNPRSTVRVMAGEKGKKVVAVFTGDGIWQLNFGRSIRPNELKYTPVGEDGLRQELEGAFQQGALHGEIYPAA